MGIPFEIFPEEYNSRRIINGVFKSIFTFSNRVSLLKRLRAGREFFKFAGLFRGMEDKRKKTEKVGLRTFYIFPHRLEWGNIGGRKRQNREAGENPALERAVCRDENAGRFNRKATVIGRLREGGLSKLICKSEDLPGVVLYRTSFRRIFHVQKDLPWGGSFIFA